MADVFISYNKSDRALAKALAEFLIDCGYAVWWDYELVGGVEFRKEIDAQLDVAKAVVVIWSARSIGSRWVIEEAQHADRLGTLVPVKHDDLAPSQIPKGFGTLQTESLADPGRILAGIEQKVKSSKAITNSALVRYLQAVRSRSSSAWRMAPWLGAAFVAGLATFAVLRPQENQPSEPYKEPAVEWSKTTADGLKIDRTVDDNRVWLNIVQPASWDYRAQIETSTDGESFQPGSGVFIALPPAARQKLVIRLVDTSSDRREVWRIDKTAELENAILDGLRKRVEQSALHGAVTCSSLGCQLLPFDLLCSPYVSNASLTVAGNTAKSSFNRDLCKAPAATPVTCVPEDRLPFRLLPGSIATFAVEFIDTSRAAVQSAIPPLNVAGAVELPAKPGQTGYVPRAFAQLGSDGFSLQPAIPSCNQFGAIVPMQMSRVSIDADGRGPLDVTSSHITWKPQPGSASVDWQSQGALQRPLVITAYDQNGNAHGPFTYMLDIATLVAAASAAVGDPQIKCATVNNDATHCIAVEGYLGNIPLYAAWTRVAEIEISKDGQGGWHQTGVSFDADDVVSNAGNSRCAYYGSEPCKPFKAVIPERWTDVFYRVTYRTREISGIRRIAVER